MNPQTQENTNPKKPATPNEWGKTPHKTTSEPVEPATHEDQEDLGSNTQEFSPQPTREVNPGRYNEDLVDSKSEGHMNSSQPPKNNDSQAV